MKDILDQHLYRYPEMQIEDIIKLYYQSIMGGGHMIDNPKKSLEMIKKECAPLTNPHYSIEAIGHGLVRFYLFNASEIEIKTINQLFVLSANTIKGKKEDLIELLYTLDSQYHDTMKVYIEEGCPMMRHSDRYRQLYTPHYRIMRKELAYYYPIIVELNKYLDTHSTLTLAIDGMCGSGKSTLAKILNEAFDSHLFHMDDFFLQPYQRTKERLDLAGENVDHERFKEEVLLPLFHKQSVHYRCFDCSRMALEDEITRIPYKPINIIEGTYSMHPDLLPFYDYTIVLHIDHDTQLVRILARNGEIMLEKFKNIWIPLENKYFTTFDIFNKAILLFNSSENL